MKRILKNKVNFIMVFLLVLAVLVFALSGTLAAYTNQGYQKGVVSTVSQEARFSSNILRQYTYGQAEAQRAEREFSLNLFGAEAGNYKTEIRVCNFPQEKTNLVNEEDINYTISFVTEALEGELTADMYPIIQNQQGQNISLEGELMGKVMTEYTYTIAFPAAAVDKIKVKVTVTPEADSLGAASNLILYREIIPVSTEMAATLQFSYSGSFVDYESQPSIESTAYHAFNYRIVVQNGVGNAVFSWDNRKLKIDPFFVEDMQAKGISVQASPEGISQMVFRVDSNEQGSYDIVFYRNEKIENESWAEVQKLVNLVVTEEQAAEEQ